MFARPAAARILGRNHGSRYYGWSFEQGVFRYFEHPVHLSPEKALEGKYVIQTEEFDLNAVQAVEAYKDLSEVERSFRQLKDLVGDASHLPSPAQSGAGTHFHRSLGLSAGSRAGEETQGRRVPMSSAQALEALRTMHVVDIREPKQPPAQPKKKP